MPSPLSFSLSGTALYPSPRFPSPSLPSPAPPLTDRSDCSVHPPKFKKKNSKLPPPVSSPPSLFFGTDALPSLLLPLWHRPLPLPRFPSPSLSSLASPLTDRSDCSVHPPKFKKKNSKLPLAPPVSSPPLFFGTDALPSLLLPLWHRPLPLPPVPVSFPSIPGTAPHRPPFPRLQSPSPSPSLAPLPTPPPVPVSFPFIPSTAPHRLPFRQLRSPHLSALAPSPPEAEGRGWVKDGAKD